MIRAIQREFNEWQKLIPISMVCRDEVPQSRLHDFIRSFH
jgi:hypothetical protein